MNKNNILNGEYIKKEYVLKHQGSSSNRDIYSSFFNNNSIKNISLNNVEKHNYFNAQK